MHCLLLQVTVKDGQQQHTSKLSHGLYNLVTSNNSAFIGTWSLLAQHACSPVYCLATVCTLLCWIADQAEKSPGSHTSTTSNNHSQLVCGTFFAILIYSTNQERAMELLCSTHTSIIRRWDSNQRIATVGCTTNSNWLAKANMNLITGQYKLQI